MEMTDRAGDGAGAALADGPSSRLDSVLADFAGAWRSGLAPRAEDWIGRLDGGSPAEATELIYQEFCLAEADGLAPVPDAYLRRFPSHRDSLDRLFQLHALGTPRDWDAVDDPAQLPEQGDEVGPFFLVRELGRGAFARVFLAEQADLDGRPVVVKVTTRPSPEPKLLARARHAHIVEVLSHREAEDGALQVVCMPFLGGATLGAVIAEAGRPPRSGRDLLERLDRVAAPEYPRADVPRPAREILGKLSYPKAVAWIFARLAEALEHAHRRGVAHGDIKPSNILLTADGLPMLFDFNLAVDRRGPGVAALGGGTLAYMPPERLRLIATSGPGDPAPHDLHRADVYALGLVLVEMLTGSAPALPEPGTGGLRAQAGAIAEARRGGTSAFPGWDRLRIAAGLRPILGHCLEADPARRYADGKALAADLDRWRKDLDPIAAPEAPRSVRLARRARRHRLPIAAMALCLLGGAVAAGWFGALTRSSRRDLARVKWARFLDKDGFGLFRFQQAGSWSPLPGDPAEIAARKLDHYGVRDDPEWRGRDDVRSLDATDRDDLEILMLEQAYRLASAWLDRPASEGDWRRGLDLLDRECARVPARALESKRLELRARLGLADPPSPPAAAPPPAWVESYLLGVEAEPFHASKALGHFEAAVAARPGLLWPRYRAASVASRLALHETSARHLEAAALRRPDNPALHTLLATSLLGMGLPDDAAVACDRARDIDPDFSEAYRAGAFIHDRLGRDTSRGLDISRLAVLKRHHGRAEAEKVDLAMQIGGVFNRRWAEDGALDKLLRAINEVDPADPDVRVVDATLAGHAGRMKDAIAALDAILRDHPGDLGARVVDATLAGHAGRIKDAIAALDAILRDHPGHLGARRNRAMYLLRLGRPEAVEQLAVVVGDPRFEEIIRGDPESIRTYRLLANEYIERRRLEDALGVAERGLAASAELNPLFKAEMGYTLARVHAAAATADPARLDEARVQLRRAVDRCPQIRRWYADDPIFSELRRCDPSFLESTTDLASVDAAKRD